MLTIQNLTVQIKNKIILNNLNLTIPQGQTHILIGPNGCGKSTLAQTIMGLKNPQVVTNKQAKINFNQHNLLNFSPDKHSELGIFLSFQEPVEIEGLPTLTFLRSIYNLHYPKKILELSKFRKKIEKYAQQIGFNSNLLDRDLNVGFSGGEKKRLEILQLMLIKPKLAILDEIDTGLDLKGVNLIADIINNLAKKEKTSFLIITHNLNLIKLLNKTKIYHMEKEKLYETT